MNKLLGIAVTAFGLCAGAAYADNNPITSCELSADRGGKVTYSDGSFRHLPNALVTDDALFADNGSQGADKICDRTDNAEVFDLDAFADMAILDTYICGVDASGNITDVIVGETGEEDMTVTAEFMAQAYPGFEDSAGTCVIDGYGIAPAYSQDRLAMHM